jgi:hypothetical protein
MERLIKLVMGYEEAEAAVNEVTKKKIAQHLFRTAFYGQLNICFDFHIKSQISKVSKDTSYFLITLTFFGCICFLLEM